jgi:hypothetical protein
MESEVQYYFDTRARLDAYGKVSYPYLELNPCLLACSNSLHGLINLCSPAG